MTRTTFRLSVAITWIVSLGIAYLVGWFRGADRAVNVAASAAHSSFHIVLYALIIVAVISAVVALGARSYFDRPSAPRI